MKIVYAFALTLACWMAFPILTHAESLGVEAVAARWQNDLPLEISVHGDRIRVENAPVGSLLEIYSVVGIKVREIEIKQPTAEYTLNIAKGYYIIRIGDTVRKVAIR